MQVMFFSHQFILHNDYTDFISTSSTSNLQLCASFYNPLLILPYHSCILATDNAFYSMLASIQII